MAILSSYDDPLPSIKTVHNKVKNMPDKVREKKSLEMISDNFYKLQMEQMGYRKVFELYADEKGRYLVQYNSDELTKKGMEKHMMRFIEMINKKLYEIASHVD